MSIGRTQNKRTSAFFLNFTEIQTMFSFNLTKKYSAIDMSQYGLKTIVLAVHDDLDKQILEYKNVPDHEWCDGQGKKFLHMMLEAKLKKEDQFFNVNMNQIDQDPQRWEDFCTDCVIFATLTSFLYDSPLHLVHPSVYEARVFDFNHKVPDVRPSLIEGIDVLN